MLNKLYILDVPSSLKQGLKEDKGDSTAYFTAQRVSDFAATSIKQEAENALTHTSKH
jgi:hypothetical protein